MSKKRNIVNMIENKEQQAVKDLLLYLKEERLIVGARLPSERTLSEELSVSRSTLRNSLKILQAKGILEVKAGSGYYLITNNIPSGLFSNEHTNNKKQISESLEAFYLFEPVAVALAAERMEEETLETLEQCLVNLSKAILIPDIDKIVENHKTFHQIIISATGNDYIVKTLQRFEHTYIMVSNMMSQISIDQRNRLFALHVNLFKSIKEKSPKQAKLDSENLIRSTCMLLAQYEEIELPKVIRDNQQVLTH